MTMSSLASAYIPVGKCYGQRAFPVQKVTVHHMAGVCSAAACAAMHRDSAVSASANYYVGNDGDIVCGVPEESGAWTSSDWDNDNRSITIECSNSYAGGNWPVGSAAYNATRALVADICTRYGIEPVYTGDASGTFTEHRMFAGTACPGDYLHERMSRFAEEVRAAMGKSSGEWVKGDSHYPDKWWYRYGDGSYPKDCWLFIDGAWYLFDADGYMLTGWQWSGGDWYYLKKSGKGEGRMLTGWQQIRWNGKRSWFYFLDNGMMLHDCFERIDGSWYAFDSDGRMVTLDSAVTVGGDGKIKIA